MSRESGLKLAGILATALAAFGMFLAFLLVINRGPAPIVAPPPDTDEPVLVDGQYGTGWVSDPEVVKDFRATLATPDFSDTPAGRAVMGDLPTHVYLWQSIRNVTGKDPPIFNQGQVGSCVSFGTSRAYEASLAVQITLGDRFAWTPLAEEVVYGGSRVEVGGGRLNGDGSFGAWGAAWVQRWGGLPRGTYTVGGKTYDLRAYSESRCRDWGRRGVPDELEPEAKKFPAGDVAQVKSWADAKKALSQGYGVQVCSDQGFAMIRDKNGVAKASGSWAHCMCLDGYHVDEDTGKEYGHIQNSWGANAHTGPVGWGSPPTSGFWAESAVVHRMLATGDSWVIAAVKGFPARKIDWFARARERPEPFRERFTLAISRRFGR